MLKETLLDLEPSISDLAQIKRVVIVEHGSKISAGIKEHWEDSRVQKKGDTSDHSYLNRISIDQLSKIRDLSPDVVLLVSDTPSPGFEQKVLEVCRKNQIPVLPVLGKGSTVFIGPFERPGVPGCVTCLDLRWEHSILRTNLRASAKNQKFDVSQFLVQFSWNEAELKTLAEILVAELDSFLHDTLEPTITEGKVGIFHRDGGIEWVPLLPSHDCPRCQLRPVDDSYLGDLHFKSHSILDLESLRVKSIDHDQLSELYVHRNIGYISSISEFGSELNFVRATARIQKPSRFAQAGHGSGLTVKEARQTAILEVVERLCSVEATNRRPVVFTSYAEIQDTAINPTSFGLHSDEFFKYASNYFEPYSPNKGMSWVWSYSTKSKKPVLVPEQIAYYGATRDQKRFVKDSSSGCALGGTLEEASLFGIFEVLERDGILNMWYGKMPIPELKIDDGCPHDVRETYSKIKNRRCEVRLFDMSHDLDLPAILAVAILSNGHEQSVVSGTSCHLNPYEAVRGALRELMIQVLHIECLSDQRRQEGNEMLKDATKIQEILDHVVVASLPEAFSRWEFLLKRSAYKPILSINEVFGHVPQRYQVESGDIRLVLESVLDHLHQKGFDVIIVNQTNEEAERGGLCAVKALIPGMTPITFGYGARRVQGLKRVFELPYKLGYASHVLLEDELNEHCHPLA